MPNGVDLSAARPDARARTRSSQILFVGRAEERKGLPVLLRAFEALRGAGVDARLTVAGPAAEEVEPLLLDPEGVEMAGRVDEDEKWRLLGEADLLCAPSLGGESFGMVLTEAFASGTPVVASDIAGYRDVVRDGRDGAARAAPATRSSSARRCATLAFDPARRAAHGRRRPRARRALRLAARGRARSVEVYEEALARAAARGPGWRASPRRTGLDARRAGPARAPAAAARRSSRRTRPPGAAARRGWRAAALVAAGAVAGAGLDRARARAARHRVDRPRAARRHARLGARGASR